MNKNCCGNCEWFSGGMEDDTQFCDEKEVYVHKDGYCSKYKKKLREESMEVKE